MSGPSRIEPLLGCQMSGILKAAAGIDQVVPIIHGPMGCASGHRIIPLFAGREPLMTTTALTEMNIIMGAEDRLRSAILQAGETYHPDLILVVLSCATSLTGEIHSALVEPLSKETNCPIFVLDGSGIVGDEIGGYRAFYEEFRRLEAGLVSESNTSTGLELTGLSTADFGCREDVAVLQDTLQLATGGSFHFDRFLFHDLTMTSQRKDYQTIHAGRLWLDSEQPCPAPFGAQGTLAWAEYICRAINQPLKPEFRQQIAILQEEIQSCCSALKDLRVGIEAESWWGLGLAQFFDSEFGFAVCLSSDRGALQYQEKHGSAATTFEDTANIELVRLFQSFKTDLVFGSSYSYRDDWIWQPFWQPVWHVINEQKSFMGINGAYNMLELLENLESQRNVKNQIHFK
jgi:nitrogenase molybdenum-iron protein alpha/beta subunit